MTVSISKFQLNIPDPGLTEMILMNPNMMAIFLEIGSLLYYFNILPYGRKKRRRRKRGVDDDTPIESGGDQQQIQDEQLEMLQSFIMNVNNYRIHA